MTQPRSHLCERARAWASARADGELSELESAMLDAHLTRCDACRVFAVGAVRVAQVLRSARLQRPARLVPGPPRTGLSGVRVLQVVAAVAVVGLAGAVAAFSGPSRSTAAGKPVSMVAGVDSPDRLRELRRPTLITPIRVRRRVPPEAV